MSTKQKKKKSKKASESSIKDTKLYQNLFRVVSQFVSGKGYVNPLSESELMERLSLPPQHQSLVCEILNDLQANKTIKNEKGKFVLQKEKPEGEYVKGIVRMHARGFGFVQPEDAFGIDQDIFIPKPFTLNAVDGDSVEVFIPPGEHSEKGPEGKIVTILSRGRTHLSGIVRKIEPTGDIIVYAPMLGLSQRVVVEPDPSIELNIGDRIVMRVVDWGSKETSTVGVYTSSIGHIDDASADNTAAIEQFELRQEFPKKVMTQAKSFGDRVKPHEMNDREDLRSLTCFTIDPDTAKDFDDALSLTRDAKGHYHLGVHIADVSHYVTSGSALDKEARLRCNSTYFPGYVIPMLPHELSSNLCSLREKVNRLTVSVLVHFDEKGDMIDYRITRSVIKSSKRFSYKQAKEVLDGKKKSPHLATLKLMVELCHLLKGHRYKRGSIEFALPELEVIVNESGVPTHTDYISYDITHQLVEEFMLKANELVAWHLNNMGKNLTYRIHDVPSEDNLRDFALLAGAFGFKLSDQPTPHELQEFFDTATDSPYLPYLATSYIRRMRLAVYSPDNIGHYGLALTHYCHFTSPIRRYVDLVVHRILFGDDDNRENLDLIAEACSSQERISAKAEGTVKTLKKLRLLKSSHEKERYKEYEAIITSIKPFGIFFDVLDFMIEGFVHISEIGSDYYVYFDSPSVRLEGRGTKECFRSGDKITVLVKDINLITLDSSWYLAGHQEADITPITPNKKEKKKQEKLKIPRDKRESKAPTKTEKSKEKAKNAVKMPVKKAVVTSVKDIISKIAPARKPLSPVRNYASAPKKKK